MDLDTDSPSIKFVLKNSVFVEDEEQLRMENNGEVPPTSPDVVQWSGRNHSKSDINLEKDNLISRLMELETEDLTVERSKQKQRGSKIDKKSREKQMMIGGMTYRQREKIVALLKGYKVRRAFNFDQEVTTYIQEIKMLQNDLKDRTRYNWSEIAHSLKMKKHLLHHTLKQKIKLKKTRQRAKKQINSS